MAENNKKKEELIKEAENSAFTYSFTFYKELVKHNKILEENLEKLFKKGKK